MAGNGVPPMAEDGDVRIRVRLYNPITPTAERV
jgi:hypothetical protein